MDPITLLIYLLIAIVVLAIIWYVLGLVELPANLRTIIILIAALIVLLWLLKRAGVW